MFNKKILCLGNNDVDTDLKVSNIATQHNTQNHGIIDQYGFVPQNNGYYHTSVADLSAGEIINIAKCFDQVVMLDQPKDNWSHWKLLLSTYKIMKQLDELGVSTKYKDNLNIKKFTEFDDFLKDNKSFCIYPWIEKIEHNGKMHPCMRSKYTITTLDKLGHWKTDPEYQKLRKQMLAGQRIPEVCSVCYKHEDIGVESYRTFETKEWISKLNINSLDDLNKIEHPYYYEVRLNNKCNVACRGCFPAFSSKIEQEYKTFGIEFPKPQLWEYSSLDIVDRSTLSPNVRLHLTGGEPSVIASVYKFMQECIDEGKTDFDFNIGTNAAVFSKKFLDLTRHFTNLTFSVSLDGYKQVNDYWRWGTNWDQVISNMRELQKQGHTISINCVPGIYNVTNLHLLFEFLDAEFPLVGMYLQINFNSIQSAYNHPMHDLVLQSMERCKKTNAYYTDGKSVRTTIDSLYNHYANSPTLDVQSLKDFFAYNDQLDRARNVKLVDYIPELEECRKYITE